MRSIHREAVGCNSTIKSMQEMAGRLRDHGGDAEIATGERLAINADKASRHILNGEHDAAGRILRLFTVCTAVGGIAP